jgi:hypothetical protein
MLFEPKSIKFHITNLLSHLTAHDFIQVNICKEISSCYALFSASVFVYLCEYNEP